MNRAVFIDRDGVINKPIMVNGIPTPPRNINELIFLPMVNEAALILKKKGFLLFVVTNQPDIARKKIDINDVDLINAKVKSELFVDDIYTCVHDDDQNCFCRKPKPGALLFLAKKYDINLKRSFMIGDRWRDIGAGIGAGCKTFFIDYKYNEKQPYSYDYLVSSLYDAALIISNLN